MIGGAMIKFKRIILFLIMIGWLSGVHPTFAQEVKPGETIGPNNWKKVEGMIANYYLDRIKHGQTILIGTPGVYTLPQEYLDATNKYSKQVKLDENDGLVGYVSGQPFPNIDPRDPKAGLKVIWNHYWRFRGDDFTSGRVAGQGENFKRFVIFENGNEVEAESANSTLRPVGRTTVPPIPGFPEALKQGIENLTLTAAMYPRDSAGTTILTQRYVDPTKWDDTWVFIPSIRRVRRSSTSQRCATLAPTDYNLDDIISGFNGKVPHFTYKLLRKQKVISISDWGEKSLPPRDRGDFFPKDMVWRTTDVLVVEQVSKDPNYCYSKRVMYAPTETMITFTMIQIYDRKGELWKEIQVSESDYDHKKRAGVTKGILNSAYVTMRNHQTARTTITAIPVGSNVFNMGLNPSQFSLSEISQGFRGRDIVNF
jgi:hypothetical protein